MLSIEYMSVMVICPTGRANDGSILADKKQWYPVFLDLTERISKGEFKVKFKGTIYQFTPATICSVYENIKKATSKRKSSFSCLFQKFILK